MYDEVIWSSGKRIATVFNSLRNIIMRETGYRIIKRTFLKEPPLDNPGGRVAGMGNWTGKLFNKSRSYFSDAGE